MVRLRGRDSGLFLLRGHRCHNRLPWSLGSYVGLCHLLLELSDTLQGLCFLFLRRLDLLIYFHFIFFGRQGLGRFLRCFFLGRFFLGQRSDNSILLLFRGFLGRPLFYNPDRGRLDRVIGCKGYGDDMRLWGGGLSKGLGTNPKKSPWTVRASRAANKKRFTFLDPLLSGEKSN